MRDVGPERLVAVVEAERRAQALGLDLHPDLAQPVGGQLAASALVVDPGLEAVEGDLPDHGVQHVLDLGGQHDPAADRVAALLQQRLEGQHLAEHAGGLGEGQRGVAHQLALAAGQHLVHAVAQFVRQGHDVPGLALVVQQQIRMGARHRRVREGARRFARPRRGVDPGVVEELPAHLGQFRREAGIGVENGVARLGPRDLGVVVLGQRGVAVPVVELVDAEPARLQRVVAVRQPAVLAAHGGDQRLDHVVLDLVGEVAQRDRLGVAPPLVVDLLVLGERVGDQREQPDVLAENLAQRLGGLAPHRAVAVAEPVEHLGGRELLAVHRKPQPRHGLVEQPGPGGPSGDVFLVQELLQVVGQLMVAECPGIAQPGPEMRQLRRRQLGLQVGVVDAVDLQREEQQLGRDAVHPLLHGLVELADIRVRHVAGIHQVGERHHPAEDLVHRLVGGDRPAELGAGQIRHFPGIPVAERLGVGLAAFQVARQLRRVRSRVKVGEVPARQRSEIGGGIGHALHPGRLAERAESRTAAR